MNIHDSLSYTVSIEVTVPAKETFRYLSDPTMLGRWALGCFNTQPTAQEGLFRGTSLFDGQETWVRIESDPRRFLVDYHVGGAEEQFPRISARIVPGPVYGRDPEHCIVSLTAWRTADMSDIRWARLRASHDAEIFLIHSQLETLKGTEG